MFFLATADAEGRSTCTHKGGGPGFVHMRDPHTVEFPATTEAGSTSPPETSWSTRTWACSLSTSTTHSARTGPSPVRRPDPNLGGLPHLPALHPPLPARTASRFVPRHDCLTYRSACGTHGSADVRSPRRCLKRLRSYRAQSPMTCLRPSLVPMSHRERTRGRRTRCGTGWAGRTRTGVRGGALGRSSGWVGRRHADHARPRLHPRRRRWRAERARGGGSPGQPLTWAGTARDPVGQDCPRQR